MFGKIFFDIIIPSLICDYFSLDDREVNNSQKACEIK